MGDELAQVQEIYLLITEFLVSYSFQIIGALFVLVLGLIVARRLAQLVQGLLLRHRVDVTLSSFTAATIKVLILATAVIVALGKLGISVTPFIATVGALGLGAGLALQGTLSNYGAGVAIILTRPFVVGDTITVQGVTGIVREVTLGATMLSNEDEVRITIPNKHIVGEIIHNSSSDSVVESSLAIAYQHDPQRAIALIRETLAATPGISSRRAPLVGIDSFGERGFVLGVRFWVRTEQLFQIRYQAHAGIHAALSSAGIAMPYPQREIRTLQ